MLKSKIECNECGFIKIVCSEKMQHKSRRKCPKCENIITYQKNIIFEDSFTYPSFGADDFIHPLDKAALNTLKKVPGLNKATKQMMKYGYEKYIRVTKLADDIKVTNRTCSYIHDMTIQASSALEVPVPIVYINQNPIVNAYTTCVDDPIIVLHSGLIELCDDDEVFAAISHEMGHIKCEHVLYHMLANFIAQFPDIFGLTKILTAGFSLALMEWSRKSELSADRAAFIVTRNKEKIISLLMKIAGGSSKLINMIDYDDFLSQCSEWDELMENFTDKMIQKVITVFRNHPFPIVRASEINKWPESAIELLEQKS